MGRTPNHLRAFALGRVASANGDADLRQVPLSCPLANALERLEQVLVNIVSQCLQGADIENLNALGQVALVGLAPQVVDSAQKRSQGLAGSSWSQKQRAVAAPNRGPRLDLRGRRRGESLPEPPGHRR